MEIQKREIYRAIAEVAYVVAKADKGLSAEALVAQSRFELLDEVTQPTLDQAYNEAINDFKKYSGHLTTALKEKAITVFTKVAETCGGFSEKERFIIDRFKQDLQEL